MDFSASIIADITRGKSKSEAEAILRTLRGDIKPDDAEIERILRLELSQFKELGNKVILEVLEKNKWVVDSCYGELILLLEKKQHQQARAEALLEKLKNQLSPTEIQRVLDNNDGNIEATAAQLADKVRDKQEKIHDEIFENVTSRFPDIKPAVILQTLKDTHWDIQTTIQKILKMKRETLYQTLQSEFPTLTREQILFSVDPNERDLEKTRATLTALLNNNAPVQDNLLAQSMIVENLVQKDIEAKANNGIVNTFVNVFDNFVRAETDAPGVKQVDVKASVVQPADVTSKVFDNTPKLEDPVGDDTEGSSQKRDFTVELQVPERVDFGENIVINWKHSGQATYCDWIAMFVEGVALNTNYVTYQWVDPQTNKVTFVAPYSCENYFFRYFHNKTYMECAQSSLVKVGPKFNLKVRELKENLNISSGGKFTVTLTLTQEFGKECSNMWIALYPANEQYIKYFHSYQWCSANTDIIFHIPKSGGWCFKLFPQKTYQPVLSLPYFIDGEDKLQLRLDGTTFTVTYSIKTLDFSSTRPWIALYRVENTNANQWIRYRKLTESDGRFSMDAIDNLPLGAYEARLLDYYTHTVYAKSTPVSVEVK